MSCQIVRLTHTACWASLTERWLADGESTGWLTCWLKKCGPYNTNGVNKALKEGGSLTSVDTRPQLGVVRVGFIFLFGVESTYG